GRVVLYSKTTPGSTAESPAPPSDLGTKILEITTAPSDHGTPSSGRCEILRNASDDATLKFTFASSASGKTESSAIFAFGRNEIVEIKPGAKAQPFSLISTLDH